MQYLIRIPSDLDQMSIRTDGWQCARPQGETEGVMGNHGRDELNDNGRLLLTLATDNRLAILNTFFDTRKGGIWHTYNGVSGRDRKRIDYILTRQAHRGRVSNVIIIPQPARPAKADSDHSRPRW